MKEERILNVSFNIRGGTARKNVITKRVAFPIKVVRNLGVTEYDREINTKIHNNRILIYKLYYKWY